jgi:hypothetical protein
VPDERSVDAEKLLYLLILGFVMEEIQSMFPRADLSPGTKGRELAERIASRLVLEADALPVIE